MRKIASTLAIIQFSFLLSPYSLLASKAANEMATSAPTISPFEMVKGLIIVQASINGNNGNFILDTGSPMMVLNGVPDSDSAERANTLQGKISGEWKKIDEFSWAGIQKYGLDALSMDITHLEHFTGKPIKGLIGYDFFGNLDLMLDFENQILMLVPNGFDTDGEGWEFQSSIPFSIEGHLAVIQAKIGGKDFKFGLDTGAGANLLDINQVNELSPELFIAAQETKVIGLSTNESQRYQTADIIETRIAGKDYHNMRYIITDISKLSIFAANKIDGLLGYPFFKSGKFILNFDKKIISIWQ